MKMEGFKFILQMVVPNGPSGLLPSSMDPFVVPTMPFFFLSFFGTKEASPQCIRKRRKELQYSPCTTALQGKASRMDDRGGPGQDPPPQRITN
jgi:hypothetical protein